MNSSTRMQDMVVLYLAERRQLGFDLRIHDSQVMSFARYADARGHCSGLTIEVMSSWAKDEAKVPTPITWARRLEVLRPFARYVQRTDPLSEIPDDTVFGAGHRRLTPHIYTDSEIVDLLAAASRLSRGKGIRPMTYEALFGLIACVGLRISEALHLADKDVDLKNGMLTVRQTKFCKSRQLPIHPSAVEALARYRYERTRLVISREDMSFFVSTTGARLHTRNVHDVFADLRQELGLKPRGDHPQVRIHDLRHTFVVRRVLLWHELGCDIDHAMLALCTYMGHAKVTDTYWYLTGVPDLMAIAARQYERLAAAGEMPNA